MRGFGTAWNPITAQKISSVDFGDIESMYDSLNNEVTL